MTPPYRRRSNVPLSQVETMLASLYKTCIRCNGSGNDPCLPYRDCSRCDGTGQERRRIRAWANL